MAAALPRIVITGRGVVCSLGLDAETLFTSLIQSKSGIKKLTDSDLEKADELPVNICGLVPPEFNSNELLARMGPYRSETSSYTFYSSLKAIEDSGIAFSREIDMTRVGICYGCSVSPVNIFPGLMKSLNEEGYDKVDPYFGGKVSLGIGASIIAKEFGITGPVLATGTGCTSGHTVVHEGIRAIRNNEADVLICTSSEDVKNDLFFTSFSKVGALGMSNRDPTEVARPFDSERVGFVGAQGGGAIVIEELEHAKRRGATIYAELLGGGHTSDAYHFTGNPDDGAGALLSYKYALKDAGVSPEQIDLVYAHAASTPQGDNSEAHNLFRFFGTRPYITAMKGNTGHLLSGAGLLQVIAAASVAKHDIIPPILNTVNPVQPFGKELKYVLRNPIATQIDYILSGSSGFGGSHCALVLRKYKE